MFPDARLLVNPNRGPGALPRMPARISIGLKYRFVSGPLRGKKWVG
jgi:hypothetical protein